MLRNHTLLPSFLLDSYMKAFICDTVSYQLQWKSNSSFSFHPEVWFQSFPFLTVFQLSFLLYINAFLPQILMNLNFTVLCCQSSFVCHFFKKFFLSCVLYSQSNCPCELILSLNYPYQCYLLIKYCT